MSCVLREFEKFTFPAPEGGVVTVVYPSCSRQARDAEGLAQAAVSRGADGSAALRLYRSRARADHIPLPRQRVPEPGLADPGACASLPNSMPSSITVRAMLGEAPTTPALGPEGAPGGVAWSRWLATALSTDVTPVISMMANSAWCRSTAATSDSTSWAPRERLHLADERDDEDARVDGGARRRAPG